MTRSDDELTGLSLGERAAIGRIEQALFGGDARLVRVGRYEVGTLLGSGGFGKVYRARDPELSRDVALKVVEAVGDREQLLREARVMATINHPNVAQVHDVGVLEAGGVTRVFVVMELVVGHDLRAWLAREPRSTAAVLDVVRQAGRGLAAAHAAGVIHRDFKPENVLVGDDGRTRVVDFGLAHDEAEAEASGAGTPAYLAPEQLSRRAPASVQSDQFAFAVAVWEAIYGARPFLGASVDELIAAMQRPLVRPARRRMARAAQRAVERALDPDPARRFEALGGLLDALAPRRGRRVVMILATAALAVGLVVVLAVRPSVEACAPPAGALAGVWDPIRRAAIGAAFHALPGGDERFARVGPAIDRAAERWLGMHVDACTATAVAHTQSPALLDRRMACLRDWRRQLVALSDAFAAATPEIVAGAPRAVSALPPLARCGAADQANAPALPEDPEARQAIDDLSVRLAQVRTAQIAGRFDEAATQVGTLAAPAGAAGYPPIAIAVALVQAEVLTASGALEPARAAARHGFDLALTVADHRAQAEAAADLALLGAYDPSRAADSLQWVATGRAAAGTLEEADALGAKLAHVEAGVQLAAGNAAAAAAASAQAIQRFRAIDADHVDLGSSLALRGSAELDQGLLDDAERDLREAVARIARDVGPEHPELASALGNLALVEGGRGHYRDAIATLDRALALQQRVLGADHPVDHPTLGYVHLARGNLRAARGDHAGAATDFAEAERIARAASLRPLLATVQLAAASELATTGHGAEAVRRATEGAAIFAGSDALSAALGNATLARALAADGKRADAVALARQAAASADAAPTGPGAVRGIIYQALGELLLAQHAAGAAATLTTALQALTTGAPDPLRVAQVRFALARALHARVHAQAALDGFPRDGDPVLRAAISAWLAKST